MRAALARGGKHLRRGEHFAAYTAFCAAGRDAEGEERELVRGLVHLAAAGYKRQTGDERGAARQDEHARRRLEPFGERLRELDLDLD